MPSRRRDRRIAPFRAPVFPGYFFVRSDLARDDRLRILRAPGVVTILGADHQPTPVPDRQIESLRIALASRHPIEVLFGVVPGQLVRVTAGPLAGVEGVVLSGPDGHDQLVISVDMLGRSLKFKLSSWDLVSA